MIIKRFNLNITLLLIASLLFGFTTKAQQFKSNTEVGLLLGASYYLGDLNTTHFNQPLAAAGLVIRRNIDQRFVYKAEVMYLNLRSDETESKDTISYNRSLHFRSPIYEISGQLEFNFLPYQPGNSLYTWTPFIYTGVSLFHFNPQAENIDGEWVDLQELGTEGQGTQTFPDRDKYSLIQFSIPIGGGVKIAVNESFNIILEYGTRKTFTDYLDDVSTTYPGDGKNTTNGSSYPIEMDNLTIDFSDPKGTHKLGEERGNPNQKDWYSFIGITLSFKLNNNTKDCYP